MPAKPVPMPICELCDRYTIAQLKLERLPEHEIDKDGLRRQLRHYEEGIDRNLPGMHDLLCNLLEINASIWDAEAAIRQGLDTELGLDEIGSRALRIRDHNRIRVKIKNQIAALVDQLDFVDCKMNHVSG
jgi:hypothetical protein